ncbi:MAG: TusE/DsrC/DsvC family sulfur relay protein [Vicinamibacterales bacterium]
MTNADQWSPDVAEGIAEEAGIALTPEHWKVISFCREDAAREGQPPRLRRISEALGRRHPGPVPGCFRKGPGKLAARISGLPKPQGCV